MKKLFTTLNSLLVATAMLFSSCSYDDSGLWTEVNGLKGDLRALKERVDLLEESLATEVAALEALIEAQVVVSGYERNEDGDVTVTLSDGKSFTAYAQPEYTAVTVYTENGVQYWATVNAQGETVPVRDAENNLVPVVPVKEEAVLPQFQASEDGSKVVVSFDGGLTWTETGAATTAALEKVSVFKSVEIVKVTNVYGLEVAYQAVVTLADGSTFAVDLDPKLNDEMGLTFGTQFKFVDGYAGTQVTKVYVPAGGTEAVQTLSGNIVDFMVEKPAGWKVVMEDLREEGEPEAYWVCSVSAPAKEAIEAGSADALGTVKVLAVTGSGKVIPASFVVSSEPVESVSVAGGNISVKMYASTATYAFGLAPYTSYNEEAIKQNVPELFGYNWNYEWPAEELGMYLTNNGDLDTTVSTLLGAEQDQSYVFWLAVAAEDPETWEVYVSHYTSAVAPFVSVSLLETTPADAKVSVKVDTTDKFYAATFLPTNSYGHDYLTALENSLGNLAYYYAEDYNTTLPFEGNLSDLTLFTEATLNPGTKYMLCVLPYDAEKVASNGYTTADATWLEFTTAMPTVKDASLAQVTLSDTFEGASKVSVKITKVTGASFYYAWVDDLTMSTLTTDADQLAYLLANGKQSKYTTTQSYTMAAGETSKTLLVAPFTTDFTYGEIVSQKLTTKAVTYNDIVVTINKVELNDGTSKSDHAATNPYYYGYTVEFTSTGGTAVDYLVYLADTSSNYPWKSYWNSSVDNVVPYLIDNPSQSYLKKTSGALTYSFSTKIKKFLEANYTPTTDPLEYKLIVVAVDADGNYSKPATYSVYYKDFPVAQ